MRCGKCQGKMFLDRTFTENKNYEAFCVICGTRKFISKNTVFGRWIHKAEMRRELASVREG